MSFFKIIKSILTFFPLLGLIVILDPTIFPYYGEFAWKILILLLFLRPIHDIFPEYKFLFQAVRLRKELGIISGVFAISHFVGYFLVNNLSANFLFDSIVWDPRGYLGWGLLALICAIILTGTSNVFSIRFFGKKWKLIQKLSYFMLLFAAIHIVLVKPEALISVSVTVISYIFVYILAYMYKRK